MWTIKLLTNKCIFVKEYLIGMNLSKCIRLNDARGLCEQNIQRLILFLKLF